MRYYISSGSRNCFYTLRYEYTEVYGTRVFVRDYHVCNLSTNAQEAIEKAKARIDVRYHSGLNADFETNPILRRDEVDWSIFQGGKYEGKSIHEVADIDRAYLVFMCENCGANRKYAKTLELAKVLVDNDLLERKEAREEKTREEARAKEAIAQILGPLAAMMDDEKSGFRSSIAADFAAGVIPRGRGLALAIDILARTTGGRRNSRKYAAEHERYSAIFEEAQSVTSGAALEPAH